MITIILTSYNQKELLTKNLEAWQYVYDKQYKDFEIIIGDDGSSDGSFKALNMYETSYPKRVFTQKDKGRRVAKLKNKAIRMAKGDYTIIFDGDTLPDVTTIPMFLGAIKATKNQPEKERERYAFMGVRHCFDWDKFKHMKYTFENIKSCITKDYDWRETVDEKKIQCIPPASHWHYSGANVMYPTAKLKKVKWAPNNWVGFGFDDYYHALTWLNKGGVFLAMKECVALHIDHETSSPDPKLHERLLRYEKKLLG